MATMPWGDVATTKDCQSAPKFAGRITVHAVDKGETAIGVVANIAGNLFPELGCGRPFVGRVMQDQIGRVIRGVLFGTFAPRW